MLTVLPIFQAKHGFKQSQAGSTLAETLISLGLMGVVLIPMLFLSSAYFLSQLLQIRQSVDSTHSAASFLNRFIEESALTQRILVGSPAGVGFSDTNQLYFAYYDSVNQREERVGYRLTTSGSNKILERLEYNNGTWTVTSPYGHVRSADVLLPSTVQFKYCLDTACTGATDVSSGARQQAMIVRLDNTAGGGTVGWTFTKGRQTFSLYPIDVALSTTSGDNGVLLSEQPKELFSFAGSTSFGASPDLTRLSLTPSGDQFNYLGATAGASGVLSTVMPSTATDYGRGATKAAPDGRVFFGAPGVSSNLWSYKNNILSTLTPTAASDYGTQLSMVVGGDGRVMFGEQVNPSSMRTWKNGVLSTLVSGLINAGRQAVFVDSNNRFYFAHNSGSSQLWSWHESTGLSTLLPSGVNNVAKSTGHVASDNRFFMGHGAGGAQYRTWKDGVLSTLLPSTLSTPGYYSATATTSDGRVFFGHYQYPPLPENFRTWRAGVLSTILPANIENPGAWSTKVRPSDNRVFFGNYDDDSDTPAQFYTWKDNILSSLLPTTALNPGHDSIEFASDGRVFFGAGSRYLSWHNGVLSTLLPTNETLPGSDNTAITSDDRVFFASFANPGKYWTWKAGVLSTLMPTTAGYQPGYDAHIMSSDGRFFWGEGNNATSTPGNLRTWKDNVLSTLLPSTVLEPGTSLVSPAAGSIFFCAKEAGSNCWYWGSSTPTYNVTRSAVGGAITGQNMSLSFGSGSPTYVASFQDMVGDFYLADSSGLKLDRYTYDVSSSQYTLTTQFTMGAWGANVGAIAIDQASAGVAALDTNGDDIYVYADRKATGTPSPTQLDLAGLSTVPTNPTGLTINGRTGDYLVIDSAVQSSGVNAYIRLFVIDDEGFTLSKILNIKVNDTNFLSVDARTETNFKVMYDDQKNLLYLTAPNLGTPRVFALTLPDYL